MFANTPEPPYFAVIFTSRQTADIDSRKYAAVAQHMLELAQQQPGFLGVESAREDVGITVSYWSSREAIRAWGQQAEHLVAQKLGREKFYEHFILRIAEVQEARFFE